MRFAMACLLVLMPGFFGRAVAQSIFNVQPVQIQGVQQQRIAPVVGFSNAPPATTTRVDPSAGQQAASSLINPKVMTQFNQLPNESNDAYRIRLDALSQKAVAEMDRTVRENSARMKALAPK